MTGRIVNLGGDGFSVNTNMLDPNQSVRVNANNIAKRYPSTTSMMPASLIDGLNEAEALDLLAYLLSRGDPKHEMFRR